MSKRRTELHREPWWSGAKGIDDRQIDKRRAKDIVELEDGICSWA